MKPVFKAERLMNMKRFLLIASAILISHAASAAYLYWQVSDEDVDAYTASAPDGYSLGQGAYAMLKSSDGATIGTTYGADGAVPEGKASINQAYYTDVGTDAGYSYYVELYNSDNYVIARSAAISSIDADWSQVYQDAPMTSDLSSIPSVSVWHAGARGAFTAVPEPTSGLMLLLGAAMLGLRRKNRSVA